MDLLSSVAMIIIIIFSIALLGAVGYVLWFAITHGVWNSFLSHTSALENDIKSMTEKAENNASALGGVISKEFKNIENKLVGAYNTVSNTLVRAANTVAATGNDTISKIKSGGDDIISTINSSFQNLGNKATTVTSQIQSTAADTIAQIQAGAKGAITQIQSAFNTVQSTLIDTSKPISAGTGAIIEKMKKSVTVANSTILASATNTYSAISAATQPGSSGSGSGSGSGSTNTVTKIQALGNTAINNINNQSLAAISQIKDASIELEKQIANDAAKPGAVVQGFQNPEEAKTTSLADSLFFNLQPLAIRDTGFLGPYPRGSYREEIATANALKAGCRFLTLQIDYTDVKMDLSLFEAPGVPTLLVRGPDGTLLSKNSGSIANVAETIADMAFNPVVPNNTLPVILYVHVVRAPNALTAPDKYLDFLSQIADALNPLAPFHLGLRPEGNFTRQKMAEELLTMPLRSLEGQIIVMSNADTSLFRRTTLNKNKYPPMKDLDFWVNVRVYLDESGDMNGITQMADSAIQPVAVLVDLKRVLALSSLNKDAFAAKGKRRYVIAMGDRTTNVSPAELSTALNLLGINVVLIDIFTDTDRNILLLSNEYSNKTYQEKPVALQYTA
jgi:ElaB/YqjD/DUF883 family membrane-anchored ribosome-binding protein